jgi:orotate phosphoribosyltransferase
MQSYQREFLDFAITEGVLRFGEFKLKSGRMSPYFFNTGLFHSGKSLARLGQFYAQAILDSKLPFDMLFGPSYKGIPLAVTAAIAFAEHYGRDVPYAFNRKEAKAYAEGGIIVGYPLQGRVLIIDDVISSGLSVQESVNIITAAGATPAGVTIALDRKECGQGTLSAVQEVEQLHGLRVVSIITLDTVVEYLGERHAMRGDVEAIAAYRARYGGA